MMNYCVLASFCLLSLATAQTVTQLTSCLTKENNLQMDCKFTTATGGRSTPNCTFTTEGKVVASTSTKSVPDNTFKNRASVTIVDNVCRLYLTGFSDDKPKTYNCTIISQISSWTQSSTLDKKLLQTCSAWSVLRQSVMPLLMALLTLHFFPEIM